jgi:endonuclease YncB( thermonuclease family)
LPNLTTVYVTEVTDGDTFKTHANEYIRLANVLAPEKGQFGYEPAKAALRSLVLYKYVVLDTVAKDVFGRFVCTVWDRSVNINQIMRNIGY